MRLFVALEIPAAVRDNLAALLKDFRALSAQLADKRPRWVRPENLHVTLKFIGEAVPEKFNEMRAALADVRSDDPVELQFHGLGFFPNAAHPRVLWAGVHASTNLPALAANVDAALETQGFAREGRAFTPHLTLARFEPPGLHEKLRGAIEERAKLAFGSLRGQRISSHRKQAETFRRRVHFPCNFPLHLGALAQMAEPNATLTSIPVAAYLLGSIPFGLLLSKLFGGADIRSVGSGNIGATNVARAAGPLAGTLTLLLDTGKGALAVFLAMRLSNESATWMMIAGLCVLLGHCFPIWLGFRGGKGVATALGVFLVLCPLAALGALILFVLVVIYWRFVSLGSISAAAAMPLLVYFFWAPRSRAAARDHVWDTSCDAADCL